MKVMHPLIKKKKVIHPSSVILSKQGSFRSNGHLDLISTLPPQLHQIFDYNNHQHQEMSFFFETTEYYEYRPKSKVGKNLKQYSIRKIVQIHLLPINFRLVIIKLNTEYLNKKEKN